LSRRSRRRWLRSSAAAVAAGGRTKGVAEGMPCSLCPGRGAIGRSTARRSEGGGRAGVDERLSAGDGCATGRQVVSPSADCLVCCGGGCSSAGASGWKRLNAAREEPPAHRKIKGCDPPHAGRWQQSEQHHTRIHLEQHTPAAAPFGNHRTKKMMSAGRTKLDAQAPLRFLLETDRG